MGAVFRQLMARVATANDKPIYERILDSMPSELRAALDVWFWPQGQGINNESLLCGYLSTSGTSILKDLSGRGHDATIYGMTGEEGNGYVDEDGNLCFDGVDDYAIFRYKFEHPTIFSQINVHKSSSSSNPLFFKRNIVAFGGWSNYYQFFSGNLKFVAAVASGIERFFMSDETFTYNDYTKDNTPDHTTYVDTDYKTQIGTLQKGTIIKPFDLHYFIAFNRNLSQIEKAWVEENMINI